MAMLLVVLVLAMPICSKAAPEDQSESTTQQQTTQQQTTEQQTEQQEEAKEKGIEFTKTKDSIKAGKSFTFGVKKTNLSDTVVFSSSNTKIATVSQKGKVKGLRAGKVTIKATCGTYEISHKITIKPKKIICIDPGHSSSMPSGTEPVGPGASEQKAKDMYGTSGISTGVPEYKLTLELSQKLKKELENRGYKVVLTRKKHNIKLSCIKRAQIANKAKADIFIRMHADASDASSVSGATALYPTTSNPYISHLSKKSKKLSSCVLDEMCEAAGTKNRGLSGRDDLTGTNWAKMPVTLIEVGFMTNPDEDRKLQTKSYQKKIVKGISNGVDRYFGYRK